MTISNKEKEIPIEIKMLQNFSRSNDRNGLIKYIEANFIHSGKYHSRIKYRAFLKEKKENKYLVIPSDVEIDSNIKNLSKLDILDETLLLSSMDQVSTIYNSLSLLSIAIALLIRVFESYAEGFLEVIKLDPNLIRMVIYGGFFLFLCYLIASARDKNLIAMKFSRLLKSRNNY